MYTATIIYEFKKECFDEACLLWKKQVLDLAKERDGFVRMQFLTAEPQAMAMGTWKDASYAQAFMKSGVFQTLLQNMEGMMEGEPQPRVWNLKYFEEA